MLFKEIITKQRRIGMAKAFIIIDKDILPTLYTYLQDVNNITFGDGEYYKYNSVLKEIINKFISYWTGVMDEVVNEANHLIHQTEDKRGLGALIDDTLKILATKQENYIIAFGQVKNDEDQKTLHEIHKLYKKRVEEMREMKRGLYKIVRPDQVKEFLRNQLDMAISTNNETFEFFHTVIANELATHSNKIRISFEETLLRMSNNLKKCEEKRKEELRNLMEELFEANRERVLVARQNHESDIVAAKLVLVEMELKDIRDKIERHQEERPYAYLEEEVEHWKQRTKEYQKIDDTITKLKSELTTVTEFLEKYNNLRTIDYPCLRKTCWTTIGENYRRRKEYCEQTLLDTSKAILTFFAIKGQDRILYKDKIGEYAIDDYAHQIYHFNHGQTLFHSTCQGEKIMQVPYSIKYYYDEIGRYILSDAGEKVYQIAPCTSTYNLNEDDGLLVKTTKDCGHSETMNPKCGLIINDTNQFELLPAAEPVNIKQTLDPAVVKYLWDSVGYILPDALYDTGMKQPRNPIYYLANRLIYHKYHKNSTPQLKNKSKEAEKFRFDTMKRRNDKAIADAIAYKAKLMQPSKPGALDDTENIQVLAARTAVKNLIEQLSYD